MTDPDNNQLEATRQVRQRRIASEAERKAQDQLIDELVRNCRQNEVRLQAAHQRIDNLEDELAEKVEAMQKLVDETEAKHKKMREWVLEHVPRKGNGNGD